ncbi:MAG: hypothetical protein QOI08_3472, partial [Actinomycetota bacterium]|nr:hypothetical protein [Actinomycetota bacterium]
KGDAPDLRSPGAITVPTSALPHRGQQRGEILDALSVRKGERSGRDLGRALLREGPHGVVVELPPSSGFASESPRAQAAMRFAGPDLPVPRVLEIGDAFDGSYAISERHFGVFLEELDAESPPSPRARSTWRWIRSGVRGETRTLPMDIWRPVPVAPLFPNRPPVLSHPSAARELRRHSVHRSERHLYAYTASRKLATTCRTPNSPREKAVQAATLHQRQRPG